MTYEVGEGRCEGEGGREEGRKGEREEGKCLREGEVMGGRREDGKEGCERFGNVCDLDVVVVQGVGRLHEWHVIVYVCVCVMHVCEHVCV